MTALLLAAVGSSGVEPGVALAADHLQSEIETLRLQFPKLGYFWPAESKDARSVNQAHILPLTKAAARHNCLPTL